MVEVNGLGKCKNFSLNVFNAIFTWCKLNTKDYCGHYQGCDKFSRVIFIDAYMLTKKFNVTNKQYLIWAGINFNLLKICTSFP